MSILASIRSQFVPIHREGYPFIGGFALASLILFVLWAPLGWLGVVATLWCAYFFRDPERTTPLADGLVVAPADGRVSLVAAAVPPAALGLGDKPLPRVSIFMSVFDCHVNRAPVSGTDRAHRLHGRQVPQCRPRQGERGQRAQCAGHRYARRSHRRGADRGLGRAPHPVLGQQGDAVGAGERFGMIRFGSRLDVYLPHGTAPLVAVGQNVHRRRDRDRRPAQR